MIKTFERLNLIEMSDNTVKYSIPLNTFEATLADTEDKEVFLLADNILELNICASIAEKIAADECNEPEVVFAKLDKDDFDQAEQADPDFQAYFKDYDFYEQYITYYHDGNDLNATHYYAISKAKVAERGIDPKRYRRSGAHDSIMDWEEGHDGEVIELYSLPEFHIFQAYLCRQAQRHLEQRYKDKYVKENQNNPHH